MSAQIRSVADGIYAAVLDAMQDAEELGGPEGEAYIVLMQRIAAEANSRAAAALATRSAA